MGNHVTKDLSYADLIQLAGIAAVEYCGGPQMVFKMGRTDISPDEPYIRHDQEIDYNSLNVQNLSQMKLPAQDYVALIGGLHTLGFRTRDEKGPKTRWTKNPYVFDNDYYKELLLRERSIYY